MKLLRQALAGLLLLAVSATAVFGQTQDQRIWGGTSTGSAGAYALAIANYDVYRAGTCIRFLPNFSNTGASTINVNAIGAKSIFKPTASGAIALTGGELVSSPVAQIVELCYDGTQFQLTSNSNASALQVFTPPQGYLTPCQVSSGSPVSGCSVGQLVQSGDVVSATALYYEPAVGSQIPIWNGSSMVQTNFAELTITIPSSRLANTVYDVYVFNNSGVVTGCIGPAWTTSTAGSGNRGSGAGTAQIGQQSGIWTNTVSISCVNGGSTFVVAANQGTMVGTILIDTVSGQVTNHLTWGQNRKWSVANSYNRVHYWMAAGDSTANWVPINTVRPSNNNSANKITVISTLPDQVMNSEFIDLILTVQGSGTGAGVIGIGFNSTTAFSGTQAQFLQSAASGGENAMAAPAKFQPAPFIGSAVFTSLEQSVNTGTGNIQVFGTQPNMRLSVEFNN